MRCASMITVSFIVKIRTEMYHKIMHEKYEASLQNNIPYS